MHVLAQQCWASAFETTLALTAQHKIFDTDCSALNELFIKHGVAFGLDVGVFCMKGKEWVRFSLSYFTIALKFDFIPCGTLPVLLLFFYTMSYAVHKFPQRLCTCCMWLISVHLFLCEVVQMIIVLYILARCAIQELVSNPKQMLEVVLCTL